jgi:hypothetical protein
MKNKNCMSSLKLLFLKNALQIYRCGKKIIETLIFLSNLGIFIFERKLHKREANPANFIDHFVELLI